MGTCKSRRLNGCCWRIRWDADGSWMGQFSSFSGPFNAFWYFNYGGLRGPGHAAVQNLGVDWDHWSGWRMWMAVKNGPQQPRTPVAGGRHPPSCPNSSSHRPLSERLVAVKGRWGRAMTPVAPAAGTVAGTEQGSGLGHMLLWRFLFLQTRLLAPPSQTIPKLSRFYHGLSIPPSTRTWPTAPEWASSVVGLRWLEISNAIGE